MFLPCSSGALFLFHCLRVHAAVGPVPPVLFHGFFRYVAYVSVPQVPGATGQLPTRSFPVVGEGPNKPLPGNKSRLGADMKKRVPSCVEEGVPLQQVFHHSSLGSIDGSQFVTALAKGARRPGLFAALVICTEAIRDCTSQPNLNLSAEQQATLDRVAAALPVFSEHDVDIALQPLLRVLDQRLTVLARAGMKQCYMNFDNFVMCLKAHTHAARRQPLQVRCFTVLLVAWVVLTAVAVLACPHTATLRHQSHPCASTRRLCARPRPHLPLHGVDATGPQQHHPPLSTHVLRQASHASGLRRGGDTGGI